MRHLFAGFVAAIALSASSFGQSAPYEKYELPNGLKVILHEDRSLPIATVNFWYSVGAQDEPPGRSGFAHLFEHLMFMGTRRVPGSQFDVLMETGGGANNASTDLHRTDYYSWGPSKLLPTLLWLDADRLEDMGLTMTQEKLDRQRDVVRNELRQTVENTPYAKADEMLWPLLFPEGHPYRTGVIGTHEDLEAANIANVKDFFATFYVPNNCSLVVAGDFDKTAIKTLIADQFGSLPRGAGITRKYVRPKEPMPLRLHEVKRFTAIDKVELARVQFTYASPVGYGVGDAELRLAGSVLASGKSSRLYKRLVIQDKLASEVSAAQNSFPLASYFQINVFAAPNTDLGKIEAAVDEEIGRLVKDGPADEELDRNRAGTELSILAQLQSIDRKAAAMNEYEYYWGEPDGFKRDLDRYRGATAASVREWATEVLRPDARIISRVLPETPRQTAIARDTRPANAAAGTFAAPEPSVTTLKNGLKVLVLPRRALPLVTLALVTKPGGSADTLATQGATALAVQMMGEGAGSLGSLQFEEAVQKIGGTFSSSASEEYAVSSMTVLARHIEKGAGLFADAVRRPRFDSDDWSRVQRLSIDGIRQALEVPSYSSAIVADRILLGDANPYGWSVSGTASTVESLTLEQVKSVHGAVVRPDSSTLIVLGDIEASAARALAEKLFADWQVAAKPAAINRSFAIPAPAAPGMRLAIVNRPGATQTFIRFAAPGVTFGSADRTALRLLNTILGGSFTSRLNQNLRENKGYTYGARSAFAMDVSAGTFQAYASVQAAVTGPSLLEFFKEFDRLTATGDITDAEVVKARETVRNDAIRGFQSLSGIAETAAELDANNLDFRAVSGDLSSIENISASDLNATAKRIIRLDKGVLVLVGDKALILEQIKGMKLPPAAEYDAEGNPVEGK